jgi:hypothetical protein
MMNRLQQIARLSGVHAKCSIPDRHSYLKHGLLYTKHCKLNVRTIIHIQTYYSKQDLRFPTINFNSANILLLLWYVWILYMHCYSNNIMIHSLYCVLYLNDCDSDMYLDMACLFCISVLSWVFLYYPEYFCIIQWQVLFQMGTKPSMDLMNA